MIKIFGPKKTQRDTEEEKKGEVIIKKSNPGEIRLKKGTKFCLIYRVG